MECVAGCKRFTGNEIKHHKDCIYYKDSMSEDYDRLLELEQKLVNVDQRVSPKTVDALAGEMAEIEIVCPKNSEPTFGVILKSGTMVKEVWEAQDEGLSGKQTKKWKSIIVKCRNCDETHEYALTRNP